MAIVIFFMSDASNRLKFNIPSHQGIPCGMCLVR
jgi:hypothetical protein